MGGAIQGVVLGTAKTVSILAGTVGVHGLLDNSGSAAKFYQPTDITTDGTYWYVADYQNNAIRRIDAAGVVTTLQLSDIDTGSVVILNRPTGITTDGKTIFLVDSGSNMIRFIDIASNKVTTIGSINGSAGSVDSAYNTEARFNQPTGITTDGSNLYVTDSGNHTVRRIVIATKAVSTVAGSSTSIGTTDGLQSDARFNLPARITTDGVNLYLTDFYNRTIRKITISTGNVTTMAGLAGVTGSADSAESGETARFYQPNGITTDGTYLYVSDSYNNTIRRITLSFTGVYSGPVTTIAGSVGISGSADGSVTTATFNTPLGITTDGKSLFVADSGNHTIRKISP
jgi:sugar lactone lactonase YvrE